MAGERPIVLAGHGRSGRGERGQVIVLTALSMTMLLGIAALSVDAAFMYDKRNRLYAAADAAAKLGAAEVLRNSGVSTANLKNFADQQVTAHGFSPGACGTTTLGTTSVCINHPPSTGSFAGNAYYVEAILTERTSTFFGGVLGWSSLTPGARAVAGSSAPVSCLITTTGNLTIGNTRLTLNGCGASVGGSLSGTNPNAEIVGSPTPSVAVVGTCSGTCGAMGTMATGTAAPIDPLAGLPAPANPGGCVAGTAATLSPGCYTSIANTVSTLNAGIYYVTGIVNIANLTGTNVLLYLTGSGQLTAANNKSLTLTAPTSGTYTGIAIYQDPADANGFSTGNNFSMSVSGVIYMPGVDVDFPNSLAFANTGCTLFVARSLAIRNGSGDYFTTNTCAGSFAGAAFLSVSMAE